MKYLDSFLASAEAGEEITRMAPAKPAKHASAVFAGTAPGNILADPGSPGDAGLLSNRGPSTAREPPRPLISPDAQARATMIVDAWVRVFGRKYKKPYEVAEDLVQLSEWERKLRGSKRGNSQSGM